MYPASGRLLKVRGGAATWEALQLSNSRAILVGAVLIDTVCFGVLAMLLTLPGAVLGGAASTTILVALAITAPVLALGVGVPASIVPARHEPEERARRAILAGAVLHLGVQTNVVVRMLCSKGPESPAAYMLHTTIWMVVATVFVAGAGAVWLRIAKRRSSSAPVAAPEPEL